eukprot:1981462-Amphidinium_carterae.1
MSFSFKRLRVHSSNTPLASAVELHSTLLSKYSLGDQVFDALCQCVFAGLFGEWRSQTPLIVAVEVPTTAGAETAISQLPSDDAAFSGQC